MDSRNKMALEAKTTLLKNPVFSINQQKAHTPDGAHSRMVYTIDCGDWVNVVPLTAQGEVILIEQHRFGTDSMTLEVPGGAVDPGEKDQTLSAVRELEEETGFTSKKILALPSFHPNPALMGNRVGFFVALNVEPLAIPQKNPDPFELITLHKFSFDEVLHFVRIGKISHSLSALAILLAAPYVSQMGKSNA